MSKTVFLPFYVCTVCPVSVETFTVLPSLGSDSPATSEWVFLHYSPRVRVTWSGTLLPLRSGHVNLYLNLPLRYLKRSFHRRPLLRVEEVSRKV